MLLCSNYISMMFLLVVFALFVSITDAASHQLRSNIGNSDVDDERSLQAQTLPPPNDECQGAMIIPSNFPGTTYTTKGVSIANATLSTRPWHTCYLNGRTKDVWYQFTPQATSFFSFSTNLGNAQMVLFRTNGIVDSCQVSQKLDCYVARPSIDVKLNGNYTYSLFVQPALLNVSGLLQLIVQRRRPPSNNLCTNATIIDPTIETFSDTVDDYAFAVHDPIADLQLTSPGCATLFTKFAATLWYKLKNPLTTPLAIDITIDGLENLYSGPEIIVTRGLNCGALECVKILKLTYYEGKGIHDFVAEGLTTYYINIQQGPSPISLTISGRTQYLSIVDSKVDKVIQLLNHVDYYQIKSSSMNLNIQASFPTSPKTINSVRLTYDSPKRNVCDNKAPYSVFGDSNGNYNNAIMQLGSHRVTATPYTQTNCTGAAGPSIVQDFRVSGCFSEFTIQYVKSTFAEPMFGPSWYIKLIPFTSLALSTYGIYYKPTKLPVNLSLWCKVNLYLRQDCGFQNESYRIELRDAATSKLIRASNSWTLIKNGHIAAGSYSLRAIIDNVTHPAINFTVVNTTCDE